MFTIAVCGSCLLSAMDSCRRKELYAGFCLWAPPMLPPPLLVIRMPPLGVVMYEGGVSGEGSFHAEFKSSWKRSRWLSCARVCADLNATISASRFRFFSKQTVKAQPTAWLIRSPWKMKGLFQRIKFLKNPQ